MESQDPVQTQKFPIDQVWNPIPNKLKFVDETVDFAGIYEKPTGNTRKRKAIEQPVVTLDDDRPILLAEDIELVMLPQPGTTQSFDSNMFLGQDPMGLPLSVPSHILATLPQASEEELEALEYITMNRHQTALPVWPVPNNDEEVLFQIFITHVAPIFDLCDHECHFFRVVPQRANASKALRYAMLSAAAKYKAKLMNGDDALCHQYSIECYNILIPSLERESATVDEDLWASVVILRFMEDVDVPFTRLSTESHILGSRLFFVSQSKVLEFNGLRLATFWCALRQEIFSSIVHGRQIQLSEMTARIVPFEHPFSHNCDCDCSYANWIVVHCAACVQICFGDQLPPVGRWRELMSHLDDWWKDRPWRFDAVSFVPDDETRTSFFPNKICFGEAPLTALQHYYLAKLVMMRRDPTVPESGMERDTHFANVDWGVRDAVLQLCGLARSNPTIAAAFSIPCLAISLTAVHFTTRDEQEALCGFLELAREKSPWQTQELQKRVQRLWGLSR